MEVDTPYPYWLEEDNMIISKFLHSVDELAIVNISIPEKISYYKWLLQKVQNNYKTKIGLFQIKNK